MAVHEKPKEVQPKSWASILKDIEVVEVLNTRVITEKEEETRCYLISFKSWVDEGDLFFHKSLIEEYWKRKSFIEVKIESNIKGGAESSIGGAESSIEDCGKSEGEDFVRPDEMTPKHVEESSFECDYKKSYENLSIEESTSIDVSSTRSASIEELSAEQISSEHIEEPRDQVRTCKRRKNKTLDDIVRQISALSDQPPEKRPPSLLNDRLQTLDKTLSPEIVLEDLENESPRATSEVVGERSTHSDVHSSENQLMNTYWSAGKSFQKQCFQCQLCEKYFDSEENLTEHELTHDASKPPHYQCRICKDRFRSENTLEEHMAANHIYRQNALKCRYCSRLYTHSKQLELHEKQHFSGDVSTVPPPLMPLDDESVEYTKTFRKHSVKSAESESNSGNIGDPGEIEDHTHPRHTQNQINQRKQDHEFIQRRDKTDSNYLLEKSPDVKRNFDEPIEEDRSSPVYMKQERHDIIKTKDSPSSHELIHHCPVCSKSFALKENMEYHWQEEHSHKPRFSCDVCGKMFLNELALESHIVTHSKDDFFCRICNKSFDRRSAYETHQRIHTMERPFQCSVCLRAFSLRTNLRRHMLTHSEVQLSPYNCHLCLKMFKHSENLAFHMLEQHRISPKEDIKLISEGTRYTSFRDRSLFDRTEDRQLDENVGDCVKKEKNNQRSFLENPNGYLSELKEQQLSPDSFNRRLIQTMKVSPHPLYMNKTSIYSEESLKRLEKFRNSPLGFNDTIHFSNKYSSSSSTESSRNLARPHSPRNKSPTYHHHGSVNKAATTSVLYHNGNLVTSEKMAGMGVLAHPGTECNECGEKFTSASLYDIHMQSHRKQAYTCEKCPKTFTRRNHYEAHMEGHESGKSKSHSCPYCHRLFSMKGNLRRHIRIHTNEAPYECPICFQRFRRSDGLKGHIKRHETLGESCPVDMVPTQAPASS